MVFLVKKQIRWVDRLSIQSKLFLMLLVASVVSILITGYVGYNSGREALQESRISALTNVQASKVFEIQSYFQGISNHIQTLSEDRFLIENIKAITSAFQSLKETATIEPAWEEAIENYYAKEFIPRLAKNSDGLPTAENYLPQTPAVQYLQYHYAVANPHPIGDKDRLTQANDGSDYSRIHSQLHPAVKTILDKFPYYDLFLIDPKTADIVYTYEKEVDVGTNLKTGVFADSNLAKAVNGVLKAPDRQYVKIADYDRYRPSYGLPAAFMVTPLIDENKLVGILAVQISADEIDRVMTNNKQWETTGLGKSGEAILVGSDYKLRSNSRFFLQEPEQYLKQLQNSGTSQKVINRLRNAKTSILTPLLKSNTIDLALQNRTGIEKARDYRRVPSLIAYAPMRFGDINWALIAKMDESEAFAPIETFRKRILIAASTIIVLITLIAILLARLFVNPIYEIINATQRIVGDRLDTTIEIHSRDELRELAKMLNQMTDKLRQQKTQISSQSAENRKLLQMILPSSIVPRFQAGEKPIANKASSVSVIVVELAGFNQLSMEWTPEKSVTYLNELFSSFDRVSDERGVEPIKTNGTAYLAVSGLLIPRIDHTRYAVEYGFCLQQIMSQFNQKHGTDLKLRIGISVGGVVAGVVGEERFSYNLWGNTVVQTRAITSHAIPDEIWVGESVCDRLNQTYHFEPRPEIIISGGYSKIPVWSVRRI